MRLTAEQLAEFGDDAGLIHFVDTAFIDADPVRIGVAVSGGGDSMALLHVAKDWSDLSAVPIEAVTVDHGLRAEAADEAAMVARFCAEKDIPHTTLEWDGPAAGGNIAAAGRDARYRLIAEWARTRGVEGILLGHTADDVAETFLMRLARKSGVDGLSLMDTRFERHGASWSRPFWQQSRADLRDYLRRHDVPWVDDPTNEDETHERPKARKTLAALAPLGVTVDGLKDVALNMLSARTALEHYALEEGRRIVRREGGDLVIPERPRPPIPPEIERRLWVAIVQSMSGASYPPRKSAMDELQAGLLMTGKHTLGGCVITKEGGDIRFTRELAACGGAVAVWDVDESVVWDGRWRVRRVSDAPDVTANPAVRALGEAIKDVLNWRDTGLPRRSLMATPAVFDGETLIAAPVAGLQNGFEARIVADFTSFLVSR